MNLGTDSTQLGDGHQHRLHVHRQPMSGRLTLSKATSATTTHVDNIGEAWQLQGQSGGAQTCKHSEVLTLRPSGEI